MDTLVILDAGYKEVFISENIEAIFGLSQQEISSTGIQNLIHPADADRFFENLKILFTDDNSWFKDEFRFKHKSGKWLNLLISAHQIPLNKNSSGIAICLSPAKEIHPDEKFVTGKGSEKRSFNNIRQLFETISEGIVKTDLNGKVLDANKAYLDLLGVNTLEEVDGSLKEYTPEKWHNFEDEILGEESMLDGYSYEYEKEYIRKDGTVIPIHVRKWLIRDEEGKPTATWSIVREIENSKQTKLALQHTIEELSMLNHYQLNEREMERAAIATTIHDELGQAMTALKVDLGWLLESIDNKEYCIEKIHKMVQITHDTIKLTQRVTSELRPGILDDLGLIPAIEWYCNEFEERSGIKCNIDLENTCNLNRDIELNLFRILQESLTNIIRHAKANSVHIKLTCTDNSVTLKIEDDGIGIPKEKLASHQSFGLIGMRERVSYCNGTIKISSNRNGTIIQINIPLNQDTSPLTGNLRSTPETTNTTRNESSDSRRSRNSARRH